jgi:hypothetical protein
LQRPGRFALSRKPLQCVERRLARPKFDGWRVELLKSLIGRLRGDDVRMSHGGGTTFITNTTESAVIPAAACWPPLQSSERGWKLKCWFA